MMQVDKHIFEMGGSTNSIGLESLLAPQWNHGMKIRGRHGTTTWNLAKRWQGQKDTELAPQGIAQAEEKKNNQSHLLMIFFEGRRVGRSIELL